MAIAVPWTRVLFLIRLAILQMPLHNDDHIMVLY